VYPRRLCLRAKWVQIPHTAREFCKSLIWKKDNWSSGDLTGNFGNQYEIIMFLIKGRHQLRGHRFANVWEFPRIPAKRLRMPAEKPVALYHRAILASSDLGDLIVDPFLRLWDGGRSGYVNKAAISLC
jgi:DNA modification methylase